MSITTRQISNSVESPVLFDAIKFTIKVLEMRTRLYRNLVVAVSLVSILSLVLAFVWWSGILLAGLGVVITLVAWFVTSDARLLRNWRITIVEMNRMRELDLSTLRVTLGVYKQLPTRSLDSMLASLTE